VFYLPPYATSTNKFTLLALVDWPLKAPLLSNLAQSVGTARPLDKKTVVKSAKKKKGKPANRHDLKFIVNQMELGNFEAEETFLEKELIVDQILLDCSCFATSVPKTFKQAQRSPDWNHWRLAIDEELKNLTGMQVWCVKQVPPGRKTLKGR
jgi:hypothetical protein